MTGSGVERHVQVAVRVRPGEGVWRVNDQRIESDKGAQFDYGKQEM